MSKGICFSDFKLKNSISPKNKEIRSWSVSKRLGITYNLNTNICTWVVILFKLEY